MHSCMCSFRTRSSGKSDFTVSANIAYGEVKLEPSREGGVYEDPDKLAHMGGGNYKVSPAYESTTVT